MQEKKCSIRKLRQLHRKWLSRFEYLEVKAENTAGGILTLWNPQRIEIIDAKAARNYLSVVIQPIGDRSTYLVTNVYGPQRIEEKLRLTDSLGNLKNLKLVDVETNNGLFTWNNKRGGESQVASKLDRFIISEDLMLLEKEIVASVLPIGGSDHWPIQLEIQGIGTPRNRPFRFENIWLSHPDFINNIEKWWAEDLQIQGTRMFMLHKRLKHTKMRLKEWNKKDFGNIFVEKKSVENKMQKLNQAMILKGFDKDKNDLVGKHHQGWENLCKQEEIF
eukprot:PITA_30879